MLRDNLVCLDCICLKFLNFKICSSNWTVKNLHILKFYNNYKILRTSNKYFFKNSMKQKVIYFVPKPFMYYGK